MPTTSYQIRQCPFCGLRYPLPENSPFGERCPACLGLTVTVRKEKTQPHIVNKPFLHDVDLHVILDNIRSAWNVGSILRSAEGFEFSHAHLCGITPTPEDMAVRKTALGAEKFVTWSYHRNAFEIAKQLQDEGFQLLGLEKTHKSTPIESTLTSLKFLFPLNLAIVVGNEVTGVDTAILEIADYNIHIPMQGQKGSFNVSVAFAVAAYILHVSCSRHHSRWLRTTSKRNIAKRH
jgi:23S rRNA (guanosine2251-2'-O)-methyltransferase